jgi:two-component system, NarL family, nitrate/nitrite response regulator NarL
MEGKMTAPSTEPCILIVDALPLRSLGISSILDRLDRSSVPSKFRLIVHTPDQAEQWIEADANCEMLIYNAGGASIADRDNLHRIKVLRALAPDVPLVIFSERESREEIISALNVGAQGVLHAGRNAEQALQAFSVILNGGSYFPSAMRPKRTYAAQRHPVVDCDPAPSCGIGSGYGGAEDLEDAGPRNRNLTARQNAVLELLSHGDSNKAIARRLGMREGTVKVHVRHIMRKFGVMNRTHVAVACTTGATAELSPDLGTAGPVRQRRLWADGRSVWR